MLRLDSLNKRFLKNMPNGHYNYYICTVKRKIHREDILNAGLELMQLQGYSATGIKDITDKIKIPKGSFYNHFNSKEEFGLEIIDFYMSRVAVHLIKMLNDEKIKPLKRIKLALEADASYQKNMNECKLGCMLGNFCQELGDVDEAFNKAVSNAFSEMKLGFKNCIQEAIDNKDLSSDYNSGQLADYIINGWQGALLRMKAEKNTKPLELFIKILFDKILV
jgi:TetR/AcrR family transcriptional repressor of nem operon